MRRTRVMLTFILAAGCATSGRGSHADSIRDLQSLDFPTWDGAARDLVRAGRSAVPSLMALAGHEEAAIQERALYALGEIGPEASAAADLLVRKLESRSHLIPRCALESLRDVAGSERAAAALMRLLDRTLSMKLKPESRGERIRDLFYLFPLAGPAAFPRLLDLLEHPEEEVRELAAQAIEKTDDRPPGVLPRVIQLLRNAGGAETAIVLAGRYGLKAREAIPLLVELLKDGELHFRASSAIWRIDPSVIFGLFDRPDAALLHLASALEGIPDEVAKAALPKLIGLLDHADVEVRDSASSALGSTDSAGAVSALFRLLEREKGSRRCVARALGGMGRAASAAVPVLLAGDVDADVLEALARIGGDADVLRPVFERALNLPDREAQRAALHGLWSLGAGAAPARPALEKRRDDPEAARVIARIEGREGDGNGIRIAWFTTDDRLLNGSAFDRGGLDVPEGMSLVVPESARVEKVAARRVVLFMEKRLSFAGHNEGSPARTRLEMGCGWKREGRSIRIATFGEWGSMEGGTSLNLRIEVPAGMDVRKDRSLEGERSPANRTLVEGKGRPALGWTKVETVPDEESAARR